VIDKSARRDIILLIGDMNAKVGSDNTVTEFTMGKDGLGEINENGEMFPFFCGQNDLVIEGTFFKHKNKHKTTWKSPDLSTENQIDHIPVSRRWRSQFLDVKVQRGTDACFDHELLLSKIKARTYKKPNETTTTEALLFNSHPQLPKKTFR